VSDRVFLGTVKDGYNVVSSIPYLAMNETTYLIPLLLNVTCKQMIEPRFLKYDYPQPRI
jgi:hypothetical protein